MNIACDLDNISITDAYMSLNLANPFSSVF